LQVFEEQLVGQFPVIFVLVGALAAVYNIFADRAVASFFSARSLSGASRSPFVYLQLGIEDFYVFLIPSGCLQPVCLGGYRVLLRSGGGIVGWPCR
jgi:hypothetical protein